MFLASGLRDKTLTWIVERRELGREIIYGDLEVEGFPFALRLVLREASYVLNPGGEGWAWHGEDMGVTLRPWDLGHLEFSIHGTHRLTYAVADGDWRAAEAAATGASEDSQRGAFPEGAAKALAPDAIDALSARAKAKASADMVHLQV